MFKLENNVLTASVLCLGLVLTGCGGGGDGGDSGNSTHGGSGDTTSAPPSSQTVAYDTSSLKQIHAEGPIALGMTGKGVTIATLDSGVDIKQVEFDPSRISGYDTLTNNGIAGYKASPYVDSNANNSSHGTAVASLLVGKHVGVAPGANLLVIKDTNSPVVPKDAVGGGVDPKDQFEGLLYAYQQGDVSVVSLSQGINLDCPTPLDANGVCANGALTNARNVILAGIKNQDWVVVLAAGNEGHGTDDGAELADDPAFEGHIITVGAVDRDNTIAPFSNYARNEDSSAIIQHFVVAPGTDVCAATATISQGGFQSHCDGANTASSSDPGATYFGFSGTSAAAPLVAGAVADVIAAYPKLNGAQVVNAILKGAVDLGNTGVDSVCGSGLLNVNAALQAAGNITGSASN